MSEQPTEIKEQPTAQPTNEMQPVAQPQGQFMDQPRAVTGPQEWSDGLLDCCHNSTDNLCLKATCCPCFTYGKTQQRLRDPSLASYESFNNDCLIFAGASYCGLSWLLIFLKRGELREKYNISGNIVGDCFLTCCCPCCSLIQNEKEVIHQNAIAKPEEGYRAPQGMTTGN